MELHKIGRGRALRIAFEIIVLVLLLAVSVDSKMLTVNASSDAGYTKIQDAKPSIEINPKVIHSGDSISLNGSGFTPGTSITMSCGGCGTISSLPSDPVVLSDGTFSVEIFISGGPIPPTAGVQIIEVETNTESANATFTILPGELSVSPNTGPSGTKIVISGKNLLYDASDEIDIAYFDNTTIGEVEQMGNRLSNRIGGPDIFVPPNATSGRHEIRVNAHGEDLETDFCVPSGPCGASSPDFVGINNFAFDRKAITIPVGSTVTWINFDNVTHTVTADDGSFNSGNLLKNQSFSQTFNALGIYGYHCSIHPSMIGTVIVVSPSDIPILSYYRSLGTNPNIVETTDLLKAADDWSNNIVPQGFTSSITTQELLTLAEEWSKS